MTAHVLLAPETWSELRDAYAAGATAEELCGRYGVSRSQLYARAREEAWRRVDLETPPQAAPPFDPDAPPPDPAALADRALRRAAHAVECGRLAEARRWLGLHRDFAALAELRADTDAAALRREVWAELETMRQAAGTPDQQAEAGSGAGPGHATAACDRRQTHETHSFSTRSDTELMRLGKRALRRARARSG